MTSKRMFPVGLATSIRDSARFSLPRVRHQVARRAGANPFEIDLQQISDESNPGLFLIRHPDPNIALENRDIKQSHVTITPFQHSDHARDIDQLLPDFRLAHLRLQIAVASPKTVLLHFGNPLLMSGRVGAGAANLPTLDYNEWSLFTSKDGQHDETAYRRFQLGQRWLTDAVLGIGWPVYEGACPFSILFGEAIAR